MARRREAGLRAIRRPGEGRLFEGLREWVPGDETRIVDMFSTAIEDDSLGIPVHRTGDQLEYAYPVAILAAERC